MVITFTCGLQFISLFVSPAGDLTLCCMHRGIRNRVLTTHRDRCYVYAAVSLAADCHFVGGHIVTHMFSRVSVGSACVRVWKRDCDVTSVVEHRVKGLQQNGP